MENSLDKSFREKKNSAKKRPGKEIKGEWPDEKIWKLISIVKLRPELWNVGSGNYRVSKPQVWQEVAAELGIREDWQDCRAKWQNLRVSFKCNLAKSHRKRSDQANDDSVKVPWRFFNAMRFIDKCDNQQMTDSTDNSNFNDDSVSGSQSTIELNPFQSSQTPKTSGISNVGQSRNGSSVARTDETLPLVETLIKGIPKQQIKNRADEHTAFGNHIASELRYLTVDKASNLKRRLTCTMLEFWDECNTGKCSEQQEAEYTFQSHELQCNDRDFEVSSKDEEPERKKRLDGDSTVLQDALHCMKTILGTQRDEHSNYGEYIANRIRICNRDNSEISTAQHHIENIVFNLSMGAYSGVIDKNYTNRTNYTNVQHSADISSASTTFQPGIKMESVP